MKSVNYLAVIFLISFGFFLPLLVKPEFLTIRDNDLGRTYIPLFSFFRESFLTHGQVPFWRPDQMMGESFIGNPLSAILNPGNILFLILDINLAAILYIFIHFLLASVFTYFLARSFGFAKVVSLAAAVFYGFSINMFVHLEAGHITMIAAFAYFPLAFLALRKLLVRPDFNWLIGGSLALTFMFVAYATIFYYGLVFLAGYWFYKTFPLFLLPRNLKAIIASHVLPLVLLLMATLGLAAIILFPQLEFGSLSTRSNLKFEDVAIPLWNFKRFLTSLFVPYLDFGSLDHESLLYFGVVPSILAMIGWGKLPNNKKIMVVTFGLLALLFVAGKSAPIFETAYNFMPFLKYSRVTTRFWFVVVLVVALLAAYALEKLQRKKLVYLAIVIFLLESFSFGLKRITRVPFLSFDNGSLYQYLAGDKELFRVYCASYCFNSQLISKYQIQNLAGETPIQYAKFIQFLSAAGNYHYPNFAVIFPPYQVWQTAKPPAPNANLLGLANVKYLASTYPIADNDFVFINKFDNVYLYLNKKFQARAYFEDSETPVKILKYSPNQITLGFGPASYYRNLVIAENFYPGWVAYVNHQRFGVDEQPPIFRKVTIPPNSQILELKYQPVSLALGKTTTLSTIVLLIMYAIHHRQRKT